MKRNFENYCRDYENIENYEAAKKDNFKNWEVHHRLETHTSDGERRLVDITTDELKALGMYWHRPANELIFLLKSEHHSLHMKFKHLSEETRKKMSEARKGEKNTMYGKHHSDEARKKMSEAKKNMSEETRKKMSEAKKGEKHPNYGKHLSEETRKKMSLQKTGCHWFNNGKINKLCYECPDSFVPGKLLIK